MKTTYVDLFALKPIERKTRKSLGLKVSPVFQLRLLEGAAKGKRALKTFRDDDLTIPQQVLWHEVLRDVEIWEETGSVEPLIERVGKLSQQLEERDQDLSERATRVCSSFSDSKKYQEKPPLLLDIDSTSLLLSPTLRDGPQDLPGEPTYSDEKISESQSCVDIDYDQEMLARSTSFDHSKWKLNFERDRLLSKGEDSQPGSVKWCLLLKKSSSEDESKLKNHFDEKVREQKSSRLNVLSKVVEHKPAGIVLDEFQGEDFQKKITWKLDNIVHTAFNIKDLKAKHDILIQSAFEKRCKGFRWHGYYGFLLNTGVLIYFRKKRKRGMLFKKAADLRNNTVTLPNNEHFRMNVFTNERNWPLRFATRERLDIWIDAINGFSVR